MPLYREAVRHPRQSPDYYPQIEGIGDHLEPIRKIVGAFAR